VQRPQRKPLARSDAPVHGGGLIEDGLRLWSRYPRLRLEERVIGRDRGQRLLRDGHGQHPAGPHIRNDRPGRGHDDATIG
jgi:hypothetical protein